MMPRLLPNPSLAGCLRCPPSDSSIICGVRFLQQNYIQLFFAMELTEQPRPFAGTRLQAAHILADKAEAWSGRSRWSIHCPVRPQPSVGGGALVAGLLVGPAQ